MRTKWGAILPALIVLLLLGAGPCERTLPDSNQPIKEYHSALLGGGNQPINQSISYWVGELLMPVSITSATVTLQLAADDSPVPGNVTFFDFKECDLDGVGELDQCPRGVGFTPYDGATCDLHGDTVYELVLDGVTTGEGTSLPPRVVTFRTRPVPAGYSPTYCTSGPAWWTVTALDATEGIMNTAGIGGDAPWVVLVTGIEAMGPWNGYDQPYETTITLGNYDYNFWWGAPGSNPPSPPYLPLLVIQNSDVSAYDLSLLPDADRMIRLKDSDGNIMDVKLPAISVPSQESLFLYIGNDGSSYYAYNDSGTHTYTIYDWYPLYMLDPPTAFDAGPAASW